jgi:hypothetical protein
VTATDTAGDPLTFAKVNDPSHGTVTTFSSNGSFVYRPTAGVTGDDTFGIQVTDSGGNRVAGTVTITVRGNRPPVAVNDVLRADGTALDRIEVLKNDSDADADTLSIAIEGAALVGTASVNADSTVKVSGLPGGFKGVTRFKYRVTDSSGATAVASAAIFVGTDPFRALFAGDASVGATEVFVDDFAADAVAITSATEGTLRLRGFIASEDGVTVAYRREDSSAPTTMDLSFVKTAAPAQATKVVLPAGATFVQDSQGADQFRVSPDGKWIAAVLRVGSADAVYVLNTTTPATVTNVSPPGTLSVSRIRFSRDSQNLYFLASGVAGGANKSLYTVTPANPVATVAVSALSAPSTADDVIDYALSPDQTRVLLQANRGGRVGLYFVDARTLQTEVQTSQTLAFGESLYNSSLSLNGGTVAVPPVQRVVFTVKTLLNTYNTYVAEASATPNPRLISSGAQAIGLRPDDGALLYSKGLQIWESQIGTGVADQLVDAGSNAWYDSTGNIVLIQQFLPSGGTPSSYPALTVAVRGSFGSSVPLGTPGMAAHYVDVSGFDSGVVIVGEGATTGTAPTAPRLGLVNALAPGKLLNLAEFGSPQQLTSRSVQVVSY